MIHVAPCSCELHVRIRELESALMMASARVVNLEAELATKRKKPGLFVGVIAAGDDLLGVYSFECSRNGNGPTFLRRRK